MRTKLLVGFGLVLAATVAVTVVGINSVSRLNGELIDMYAQRPATDPPGRRRQSVRDLLRSRRP